MKTNHLSMAALVSFAIASTAQIWSQLPVHNGNGMATFQQQMEAGRQRARQMEAEARARQEAMRQQGEANTARMQQGNAAIMNSMKSNPRAASSGATHGGYRVGDGIRYSSHTREWLYGGSGSGTPGTGGRSSSSSGYSGSGGGNSSNNSQVQSAQAEAMARAREEQWRQSAGDLYSGFGKGLLNGGNGLSGTPSSPWGFGPLPTDVSPQQAGLSPQTDGATFVTDDGEIRAMGYTGGVDAYVNDYVLQREMAGRPLPPDFFDHDPAVVSYDGLGNPIGSDGFVVEYQSPAHRQAAIIEARQAALESAIERAAENARWADALKVMGDPSLPARSDSSQKLGEAWGQLADFGKQQFNSPQLRPATKKVIEDFNKRWEARRKMYEEAWNKDAKAGQ